jgi:hypothetical protein
MGHGLTVSAGGVTLANQTWFYGQDTAGTPVTLLTMWSDNNCYLCDTSHVLNLRGSTVNLNGPVVTSGTITAGSGLSVNGGITGQGNLFMSNNGHYYLIDNTGRQWCMYADNGIFRIYNDSTGDVLTITQGGAAAIGIITTNTITVNGAETINGGSQAQSYHTVGSSAMLSFDNRDRAQSFGWYAVGDWAYLWYSGIGNLFQFTGNNFWPSNNNTSQCGGNGQAWSNVWSYGYPGGSSRSYKTDIAEIPSGVLEKVKALRAVHFRWRDGPDTIRPHYGFIADEVATVLGEDWGGYHRDGEHEAVDKTELVAVLWKACQELAARVATLEARA